MLISDIAIAQFTSASTAGDVAVMFGFVPDFAIYIQNHGGTNPNVHLWANNDSFSQWAAELALLITGSTGVITRETTTSQTIIKYAGGDHILLDANNERWLNGVDTTEAGPETANSDPKHVDQSGAPVTNIGASSTTGPLSLTTSNEFITQAGILIAKEIQTNSGANLVIAFRNDR